MSKSRIDQPDVQLFINCWRFCQTLFALAMYGDPPFADWKRYLYVQGSGSILMFQYFRIKFRHTVLS